MTEIIKTECKRERDVNMSNQKQIQRQAFLTAREPEEITSKKTFQKPSERCGRPSERLSESQLNKAVQIVSWDMAKQGKVKRWRCPEHAQTNRSFDVSPDGVRVWCESCGRTTHFELTNFQGSDDVYEE